MISIVAPLLVLYFLYVGKKHGGEKIGCSSPSGIAGRNNLEPKGLNNLSNTCFLNAVLQALYMSEPYNELITSSSFADGSVGSELQNVFKRLGDCTEGPVRPVELAVLLGLNIDEQQDAEELLLQVLNGVDDSVKQRSSNIRAPSRALQIKTLQRLSCTDVAFKKEKVHRSFDISLDIAGHRDVNAALKAYFQPEPLVGANQYQTGKLGLQDAVKSLFLLKNRYNRSASAIAESGRSTDELPEVLVLHLKRFAFDPSTGAMTKVRAAQYTIYLCFDTCSPLMIAIHSSAMLTGGRPAAGAAEHRREPLPLPARPALEWAGGGWQGGEQRWVRVRV